MKATFERWYTTAFQSLQARVSHVHPTVFSFQHHTTTLALGRMLILDKALCHARR